MCRLEQVLLEETSANIMHFLNNHLSQCATQEQNEQIVREADGLFIYAAMVVEYVGDRCRG